MKVGSSRPDSTTTASLRPVGVTCDPVMTVWKERREGKGEERRTEKKKEQSLSHLKTHALSISQFGRKKVSKNNSQRPNRQPGTKDSRWVFKVFLTCYSCHGLQTRVVLLKFTLPTYY